MFLESKTESAPLPESGVQKKVEVLLQELVPENIEASYEGKGGEHVVFTVRATEKKIEKRREEAKKKEKEKGSKERVDELRDSVYKVNYYASLYKYPHDFNDPEKRDIVIEKLAEDIVRREKQIKLLRSYFGFHAVPAEQSMVRMLPLSPEIFNRLKPDWITERQDLPKEVPTLLTIQRRFKADPKKDPAHAVDLTSYYADDVKRMKGGEEELSDMDYDRAHRLLMGARVEPKDPFATEDMERENRNRDIVKMFPKLLHVVERQQVDRKFSEELQKSARQMVAYAENMHLPMLDVAGKNNVLLLKQKDASWRLFLPDVIPPGEPTRIDEIIEIAQDILDGNPLEIEDRMEAGTILHFLRFVNALAMIANIPERVPMPKAVLDVPSLRWRREIEKRWQKEATEAPVAKQKKAPLDTEEAKTVFPGKKVA
ncbi:MAG: hypothetical protein RL141_968 [Candidatus Parcubacteria bacterium]